MICVNVIKIEIKLPNFEKHTFFITFVFQLLFLGVKSACLRKQSLNCNNLYLMEEKSKHSKTLLETRELSLCETFNLVSTATFPVVVTSDDLKSIDTS